MMLRDKALVICFFVLHSCIALVAQKGLLHVVNPNSDKDEVELSCGSRIRLKLADSNKLDGKLDTVFADGFVLSGDTVFFSQVERIKYRYPDPQLLGTEASLGGLGLAVSGVMMAVASIMSDEEAASSLAGKAFLVLAVSVGVLIHSGVDSIRWYHRDMADGWSLYSSI